MKFLFENPILLIALIGIVSSLFKRLKGDSGGEGKHHTRGPFTQTTQPINSRPVERKKPVMRNKPLNEVLHETRKIIEQKQIEQPLVNKSTVSEIPVRNPVTPIQSKKTTIKESSHVINKSRLVDGVIWTEVLGPPRSKKPHTAIKPMYRVRN
jgi:hypothetical protein